jgi:transcriptional regulator with XRE-family HTH domain
VSTQTPDRAQVIPLRPAVAPASPGTGRVRAEHGRATLPGAARDRAVLRRPLPGQARPAVRPAVQRPRVADREPLLRHVVGEVLRRERLSQGLRLKDVADAARISMPYLSEIERGRKEASSEVLAAAARALGIGLADLLALAQDDLARFAAARRPSTGDPVRPEREPGTAQAVPAGDGDPDGDGDGVALPAGRLGGQQAEVSLVSPVEPVSPPQPGTMGPPQVRMSLAA